MEQSIQDFINCKRIAVVGCSSKGRKFGNSAYKELKQRGYQVLPVHPFVFKKCILMYAPPVKSLHKFHRSITNFFGRL